MSLLNKSIIPEEYRNFIEEIPTAKQQNISSRASDDETDE